MRGVLDVNTLVSAAINKLGKSRWILTRRQQFHRQLPRALARCGGKVPRLIVVGARIA